MHMIPVKSGHISSVGHEERTGLMKVCFHSGHEYMYGRVDADIFNKMLKAESVGKFFAENIKGNARFPTVKMDQE